MSYTSVFTGAEIDAGIENAHGAVLRSGSAMTGPLILHDAPTDEKGAATKKYVDDAESAKAYTDEKAVSTLDEAKRYTDDKAETTLSQAKSHASSIIPTTLPNPAALNFTGAASGSYDGSKAVELTIPTVPSIEGLASKSYVDEKVSTIDIPSIEGLASETYVNEKVAGVEIPNALPNPYALTFTGAIKGTYDGSNTLIVNIPEGGNGGGASSWNDLKDKPFGELTTTEVEFMSARTVESNPEFSEGMITDPLEHMPIVDEVYTVNWNGVNYVCTARVFSMEGISAIALGNLGAMTGEGDTEEPFLMLVLAPEIATAMGAYAGVYILDGSASVTVSISGIVKAESKLDNKYLDLHWLPTEIGEVETEFIPAQVTQENGHLIVSGSAIDQTMLTAGAKFAIYIDGNRYESSFAEMEGFLIAGNFSLIQGDMPDTMQPYLILVSEEMIQIIIAPAAVHTVSVYMYDYGANKLPMSFIPDNVPTKEYIAEMVNGFATKTYVEEKISAALAAFSNAEEVSF